MIAFTTAILPLLAALVPVIKAEPTMSPLFTVQLEIGEATESVELRGATQNGESRSGPEPGFRVSNTHRQPSTSRPAP
jgi:hypothetical protein